MNPDDMRNAVLGIDPNALRGSILPMTSGLSPASQQMLAMSSAKAQVESPRTTTPAMRIMPCKNGYIIMPDTQYNNTLDGAYIAKDLDEVKDVLARHYVTEKLA